MVSAASQLAMRIDVTCADRTCMCSVVPELARKDMVKPSAANSVQVHANEHSHWRIMVR